MSRLRRFPVRRREAAPAPPVTTPDRASLANPTSAPAHGQYRLPFTDAASIAAIPATESIVCANATRRLWFCVYLPKLSLEAIAGGGAPFAVVEEQHGVHRILLANAAAAAKGVQPGQSANAALALLPELALGERSELVEQQTLESLAAWLEGFSSFVTIAAHDVLLLEIGGSLRLFGGLPCLRQQVAKGLGQQGFSASLAIAPTPLAATWLARSRRRVCVRDPANLAAAIRRLPLAGLAWPPAVTEALQGMGVTTVGDCLRLPRDGFARRFGAGRLIELDRAVGRLPDPRASWRAPERFCADYEMTEEQSDRELLLAISDELLAAHERFLLARQLGTQRLGFSFYHLKADATKLALGCATADRSAARWSALLRMRFERLSLPEPVIAVRLLGGRTEALHSGSERLAFQTRAVSRERHAMTQLAERLAARIGHQSVNGVTTAAEHRPQRAWRIRDLFVGKTGDALSRVRRDVARPRWMLPEPKPLPAECGHPLHQGRLQLLDGPERLETGWWDDDGIARDYYTAVNPRGMRLWVFRDRRAADWYLHGVFG
ncbi:MAG: DNA polymerase Y family protein [Woeseiaceae bacterium]|nr:DNA polymerase Y family protein [Woeseiaceae bacterium]